MTRWDQLTEEEQWEQARADSIAERVAQGLTPTIDDPVVLRRVARIFGLEAEQEAS